MFEATPAQSEYVTRKKLIDRRLKDAGWGIVGFDPSKSFQAFDWCAIEEFPTESGLADYALCVAGRILGVVEEKKLSVGPQETVLNDIPIPLPPTNEQAAIIRRVKALFKLADAIDRRVAAAYLRAQRLTQAVLAKAFRGELVPTEAELARREGRSYEPASELLERIKAEGAKISENGTKRTKAWK